MTTISQIITAAYRDNNLIPVGTATNPAAPTTAEIAEALTRLNAFFRSIFGVELGIELSDWAVPPSRTSPVAARYSRKPLNQDLPDDVWPYPPSNVRVLMNITSATTIYLPSNPDDGARLGLTDIASTATLTLDANGRRIESAATLAIAPGTDPLEWFYRADLGSWVRIVTFVETDESPLPTDFDDFLILALSIRLSGRVGKTAQTQRADVQRMIKKIKARYRQEEIQTIGSDIKVGPLDAVDGFGHIGSLLR